MSTITNDFTTTNSPKRVASIQQVLPDSPDYVDKYTSNSDDHQPTSNLYSSSTYQRPSFSQQNLVVVGSHEKPITLGRGGACTIKIGRRNRNVSRVHVSIAFNNEKEQFELTVLGLNGACVDDIQYDQHAIVPLENDSFVDVLGDHFSFKIPPPPSSALLLEKLQQQQPQQQVNINKNINFFKELSPEPKQESDSIDLVSDEALSPVEQEVSPEPQPVSKTSILQDVKEQQPADSNTHDYAEVIIDALVFSRTSSMPISDICSRILKANPAYANQPRQVWMERIRDVLKDKPFFGEIKRKGKTADGSPVENLYYYNSELDPVEWRRSTYTQVGRSARKCTLKDKQYFWKIPPKLGRHRSAYIPPPATDVKKHKKEFHDENIDPKKIKY